MIDSIKSLYITTLNTLLAMTKEYRYEDELPENVKWRLTQIKKSKDLSEAVVYSQKAESAYFIGLLSRWSTTGEGPETSVALTNQARAYESKARAAHRYGDKEEEDKNIKKAKEFYARAKKVSETSKGAQK